MRYMLLGHKQSITHQLLRKDQLEGGESIKYSHGACVPIAVLDDKGLVYATYCAFHAYTL